MIPETWPVPHPTLRSVVKVSDTWKVTLDLGEFQVTPSSYGITVFHEDHMPIWDRWFGIFMVLKDATTGPDSAWEMLIPTSAGCHDNLNQYHFKLIGGSEAAKRSGSTRVVPWETGQWKPEYDAARNDESN